MYKGIYFIGVLTLGVVGCPAEPGGQTGGNEPEDESTPEDDEGTQELDPTATSGQSADDDEGEASEGSGETSDTDGCSFLECDTDGDTEVEPPCNVWDQDCDDGEKCMPYADDGGTEWNATRCVPLHPDNMQPGDPCQTEMGGTSGYDNCGEGAMCWATEMDGRGVCIGMCSGTLNNPLCDDIDDTCISANEGVLNLCLPRCDPLSQDCEIDGMACYPGDDDFVCVYDASGPDLGAYGDACGYTNSCDAGLLCATAELVPGCNSPRCCTEFCDADPDAGDEFVCSGSVGGQECVPFFEEGQGPPMLADAGFCGIPQ